MSHTARQRLPLISAGVFGGAGVALGALGAHRLESLLAERGMARAWETGARYHIYHAIALLAVAALISQCSNSATRWLGWAARCWSVGIVLFSGSLYWFALGGPHPLVYVTPLGGIALMAGWGFVIAAALTKASANNADRRG